MASTQSWTEYNGTNASTAATLRTDANWKRIDDSSTIYTAHPINSTNNENSMTKYQAIVFSGTWNSLSSFTYKIDNNSPAVGLTIVGSVVSTGTTPSTIASGDTAMSTTGLSANFTSSTTPYATGTATSSSSGTMYVNVLRTQLQTTASYTVGPGDILSRTITASWTES